MNTLGIKLENDQIDWDKGDGLIPAIVQDDRTGIVLMLGYMNQASLARTLQSEQVTFFSRSRGELWTKGETSGHFLQLRDIRVDCDGDTLLILARPTGPACHRGSRSCFGDDLYLAGSFLSELESIIQSRRGADPSESYTARLLDQPVAKSAQKVGEEGVEVALAAVAQSDTDLLNESADLLYHLLVLLTKRDRTLADVVHTLEARHQPKQ